MRARCQVVLRWHPQDRDWYATDRWTDEYLIDHAVRPMKEGVRRPKCGVLGHRQPIARQLTRRRMCVAGRCTCDGGGAARR
jgi:hypothetical protein